MTTDEAIEQITSQPKWYIGKMPQSTASNFLASYKKGMAKKSTIDSFLSKFGYELKQKEQWEKIDLSEENHYYNIINSK